MSSNRTNLVPFTFFPFPIPTRKSGNTPSLQDKQQRQQNTNSLCISQFDRSHEQNTPHQLIEPLKSTLLRFSITKQLADVLDEHRCRMKLKRDKWQQEMNGSNGVKSHDKMDDDNDSIASSTTCSSKSTEVLDPTKCMIRFQKQATESIHHVYEMDHVLCRKSRSGALITSLAEDLLSLMHTFVNVLDTLFLSSDDMDQELAFSVDHRCYFVNGLLFVVRVIRDVHCLQRYKMLLSRNCSLEDICSASNDFFRISEKLELFLTKNLINKYSFLRNDGSISLIHDVCHQNSNTLNERRSNCTDDNDLYKLRETLVAEWNEFSNLVLQDSVYAAERCQIYTMTHLLQKTTISRDFFSLHWENEWISNDAVIITLINVINEHMNEIRYYLLNDFLYNKALIAYVKSIVCFYVRCLIQTSNDLTNHRRIHFLAMGLAGQTDQEDAEGHIPFQRKNRALRRMKEDISTLKQFFQDKTRYFRDKVDHEINSVVQINEKDDTVSSSPTLLRLISKEIWILEVIHECLSATAEIYETKETTNHPDTTDTRLKDNVASSLESFIVVLHKHTGGNALVTRFLVSDLWLLAGGNNERQMKSTIHQIEPDLELVTQSMQNYRTNSTSSKLNAKSTSNNNPLIVIAPYVNLNEMLKVVYEDRLAQSICIPCFIPNNIVNGFYPNDNRDDYQETDIDVQLARQIESITRKITQFPKEILKLSERRSTMYK